MRNDHMQDTPLSPVYQIKTPKFLVGRKAQSHTFPICAGHLQLIKGIEIRNAPLRLLGVNKGMNRTGSVTASTLFSFALESVLKCK